MSSPNVGFPPRRQFVSHLAPRVLFVISFLATLPIVVTLVKLNGALENGVAPQGVVSLELARTSERQSEVLGSWMEPQKLRLAFMIGLDFLLVPAFIATLTLACNWLTDLSGGRARLSLRLGEALGYSLLTMSLFWVGQNALLAGAVFGHGTALSAQIIYRCALLKFTVMGVSFAYMVLYAGAHLLARPFRRAAGAA